MVIRLRTANILLIGVKALGNEIAKNLVLAGIGSLTISDDQPVHEDDLGAQFFISERHIGMNVSFFPRRTLDNPLINFLSERKQHYPKSRSSTPESVYKSIPTLSFSKILPTLLPSPSLSLPTFLTRR